MGWVSNNTKQTGPKETVELKGKIGPLRHHCKPTDKRHLSIQMAQEKQDILQKQCRLKLCFSCWSLSGEGKTEQWLSSPLERAVLKQGAERMTVPFNESRWLCHHHPKTIASVLGHPTASSTPSFSSKPAVTTPLLFALFFSFYWQ